MYGVVNGAIFRCLKVTTRILNINDFERKKLKPNFRAGDTTHFAIFTSSGEVMDETKESWTESLG